MLTRREHSRWELMQKLQQRDFPKEDIENVLTALANKGLQSDQRFTESFIRWRSEQGFGPLRIELELESRGVAPQVIAEALDITDNAWLTCARKTWQKRFKGIVPSEYAERAKQMRYLQYKGFTREQIDSVFKK